MQTVLCIDLFINYKKFLSLSFVSTSKENKLMFAFASMLFMGLVASPVSATYYLPGVVPHSYDEYENVSNFSRACAFLVLI